MIMTYGNQEPTPAPNSQPPIVLLDEERQRCEVWTRVMGYHRPVSSFNIGKQGEVADRVFFVVDGSCDFGHAD
jgi:hypothetical protein